MIMVSKLGFSSRIERSSKLPFPNCEKQRCHPLRSHAQGDIENLFLGFCMFGTNLRKIAPLLWLWLDSPQPVPNLLSSCSLSSSCYYHNFTFLLHGYLRIAKPTCLSPFRLTAKWLSWIPIEPNGERSIPKMRWKFIGTCPAPRLAQVNAALCGHVQLTVLPFTAMSDKYTTPPSWPTGLREPRSPRRHDPGIRQTSSQLRGRN